MSERDRRPKFEVNWLTTAFAIAAFLLLVPSVVFLVDYRADHIAERYEAANAHTSPADYDAEGLCEGPDNVRAISCLIEQVRADQIQRYAAYDLMAQQDMAEWAFGVLAATVIGVFLIAATLCETLSAGREMRRQNLLSLNATKAEFEPHLARRNIKNFRIVEQAAHDESNVRIVALFEFKVQNTGKTSAYNIGRNSAATLAFRRFETTETARKFWTEEVSTSTRGLIAHEIPPKHHETVPFRFEFNVPKAHLEDNYSLEKMRFEVGIRIGFIDRFSTKRRLRRVVSFVFWAQDGKVENKGSFESIGDARDDPDAWNKVDKLIPHAFYGLGVLNKIPHPEEHNKPNN
ncbi:hypothetical protein WNY37_17245 [Henriciella sp. AS95]|uniref:hypothetical protein n=1 Tax=Henriciella sp. AS95 TaxID=3135782 RepID=UPI00316C3941